MDVTDQKGPTDDEEDPLALQEQVRTLQRQLDEMQQGTHELIAMLAHELRTPLGAVLMWTHVLRMGREDDREPALEAIEASAQSQSRLINSLLDLTRAMAGRLQLSMSPLDLGATALLVAEELRGNAAQGDVSLKLSLGDQPLPVRGDANRLREMVSTLVNNAISAAPGGAVDVTARVEVGVVRLTVHDSGPRLAPEEVSHLFTPFRLRRARGERPPNSLGLEMPLVRLLAELHGGKVTADSPGPGPGTTLILELPLAAD